MSDLAQYQTHHLFLLVGANPLPNYVAARLLANDGATVYLLHSGGAHGTAAVAERLHHAIERRRPGLKPIRHEVDEANAARIRQRVSEIVGQISKPASVGLNYTGGTKAMAVHTYQAIKQSFPSVVSSYLDARTLSLVIDGAGQNPIPVQQSFKLALDELLELHGGRIVASRKDCVLDDRADGVDYHPLVQALLQLSAAEDHKEWQKWCQTNLKKAGNRGFRPSTELAEVPLPDKYLAISAALGNPGTLGRTTLPRGWKLSDLAEFLDGKWLEHYVLHSVKKINVRCDIHDWAMSLQSRGAAGRQFEFDAAAMRGYQLFAVSCTTESQRGMCKLKLFEAYVRARQLGGDEARAALVCCNNDPSALQQEIEEDWFTEGRVRVFGRTDLRDLDGKLKEWFETIDSGERARRL